MAIRAKKQTSDEVDYIMETFPIVRKDDEKKCGSYRTKEAILNIYDQMQQAIDTGGTYQTVLDPPPADPRVAHPPRPEEPEMPSRRVWNGRTSIGRVK